MSRILTTKEKRTLEELGFNTFKFAGSKKRQMEKQKKAIRRKKRFIYG